MKIQFVKQSRQFSLILCLILVVSSVASHFAVSWLKIRATPVQHAFIGPQNQKPSAFLAGSSLAFYGLNWTRIAQSLGISMETWMVAGSSPAEWEVFQDRVPQAASTFIVVSAFDMNEDSMSDFHADVVPLRETVRSLRQCGANWQFYKRVLSQYPLMLVRKLFPTAGRSDGVMVGIRGKLEKLVHVAPSAVEGDAPKFGADGASVIRENITDWSEARLQRRLVLVRNSCQGQHSFNGPKKLALIQMLQRAEQHGKGILVVLPVSPIYNKEFLPAAVLRDFDKTLADVRLCCPQTRVIRLDSLPELDRNTYFWDLVHMNTYAQEIATTEFLNQLQLLATNQ